MGSKNKNTNKSKRNRSGSRCDSFYGKQPTIMPAKKMIDDNHRNEAAESMQTFCKKRHFVIKTNIS